MAIVALALIAKYYFIFKVLQPEFFQVFLILRCFNYHIIDLMITRFITRFIIFYHIIIIRFINLCSRLLLCHNCSHTRMIIFNMNMIIVIMRILVHA